jgi:hypothetical protein
LSRIIQADLGRLAFVGWFEFPGSVGVFVDVNVLEVAVAVMLRAQVSEVPNVGVAT